MSDNIIGRVTLNRPDAFNEVFNALRKMAGKDNYFAIQADKLLTFTVGYPGTAMTEVAMQPQGVHIGPNFTVFDVTNFTVDIPFSIEMLHLNVLKKLTKLKPTDKVVIEHIRPDNFKDVVRLTINGFVDEFEVVENRVVYPSMNEYLQSAYQREQKEPMKKFCFLNKAANGTLEAMHHFGKTLSFLAKNYTENHGGRAIVSNIFIGRNEHTNEHFYDIPIIGATNGFTAYVNTMDVVTNDKEFFVHIPRQIADALGSVMSNTKMFSGKAVPEISEAWQGSLASPQPAEKGIRNFVARCKVFHVEKQTEINENEGVVPHLMRPTKLAFFEFTANETLAHFTVMINQNEDYDGYLDAIDGVFAPCTYDSKTVECAPKIDIAEFMQASERVAKGSHVTLKNIEDTITCEAAVLVKGDPLGTFTVDNESDHYPPEDVELCLNTEFLRTACKAVELDGATYIHLLTKKLIGEKDEVVLITGNDQSEPYVAVMTIRK